MDAEADALAGGLSQQDKDKADEVAKTLNNPGSVADDVNQADKDN